MEKLLLLLLPVSFGVGLLSPGAAVIEAPGLPVTAFADPEITESSGLVALPGGLLVTVNDSGDTNRVFTVDPASGETVGVTRWQGEAVDIEALAPAGLGEVWVGDIGDNLARRPSVTVSRVPVGTGDRRVTAPTYELVYPDGPHDAETLLSDPTTGRLYVVAKEFIGTVYAAPERLDPDGPNALEEVGRVIGIGTDGAFWPDARHVVIRNYRQAAFYTWPALERLTTIELPEQEQGEGLAVTPDGRVLLSSEGVGAEVLEAGLPDDLRSRLDAAPDATRGSDPQADDPREDGPARPVGDPDDTDSADGGAPSPVVWLGGGAVVVLAAGAVLVLRRRR